MNGSANKGVKRETKKERMMDAVERKSIRKR